MVVDVGGGTGSQSLTLAQNYKHIRFIVQDREMVILDAVTVSYLPFIFHLVVELKILT